MTYTQRGLPLPVFKLTSFTASPYAVNPSATAPFLLRLTNQGAPDRWDITRSGTAGWLFFRDDGDGVWNAALDTTALADTDGNGKVDTGLVAPAGELTFWAVLPTTAATPVGTYPTTITATSAAQPLAAGGTATVALSVSVQTGPVSNPTPTPSVTPTPDGHADAVAHAERHPHGGDHLPRCGRGAERHRGERLHPEAVRAAQPVRQQHGLAAEHRNGAGDDHDRTGDPADGGRRRVEFPTATDPLVYSDDISPAGTPGRILGTSTGSQVSGTNPATMVDWRGSTTTRRDYSGTAVPAVLGRRGARVAIDGREPAVPALHRQERRDHRPSGRSDRHRRVQLRRLAGGLDDDPGHGEHGRQPSARSAALEQRHAPVRLAYDTVTFPPRSCCRRSDMTQLRHG